MMLYLIITLLVVWDIYWKIQSLWCAAQKNEKAWFVALMILNTVGILPIYYLYKQGYFKNRIRD